MPKHDILIKPGEEIPEIIRSAMRAMFTTKDLEKLTRHGGLVRVSLAAPYSPSKGKSAKRTVVDKNLLDEIEKLKGNREKLEELFSSFKTKALLDLCKLIGMPISKSVNTRELKYQLLTTFQAGHIWNKIAGNNSELNT